MWLIMDGIHRKRDDEKRQQKRRQYQDPRNPLIPRLANQIQYPRPEHKIH